jgi:hypothetical protein
VDFGTDQRVTMLVSKNHLKELSQRKVVQFQGDLSITGNISSNGFVLLNGPEAQFRHQSGNYLFINDGGWGVYSNNGMVPLSVVSGGELEIVMDVHLLLKGLHIQEIFRYQALSQEMQTLMVLAI